MSTWLNYALRGAWILVTLVACWQVWVGWRSSIKDMGLLRTVKKNGVLALATAARKERWTLRSLVVMDMLLLGIIAVLAPTQPLCPPGGGAPLPSATGVALSFGFLLLGLLQVVIFGQDNASRQAIDEYNVARLLAEESDESEEGG